MASPTDDDERRRRAATATATGYRDVGGRSPATGLPSVGDEVDEGEPTARQALDSERAISTNGSVSPTTPKLPLPPPRKPRHTVMGLAPPPPHLTAPVESTALPTFDDDTSVTATAPSLKEVASQLPLTVPGEIEIREVREDEPLEETEVRTLVTTPSSSVIAAPTPTKATVTATATAMESVVPATPITAKTGSEGKKMPSSADVAPHTVPMAPDSGLPELGREDDAYSLEESVTMRGLAHDFDDVDNNEPSVITAQAPTADQLRMPTLGAVKPKRSTLPDDEDGDSRTTQAPNPGLGPSSSAVVDSEPDDRTAVMANAPVKAPSPGTEPYAVPTGRRPTSSPGVVAATRPANDPESGLQMAVPEAKNIDRVSERALLPAGSMPQPAGSDVFGSAPVASLFPADPPRNSFPSHHQLTLTGGKKPPYGLLVIIVAAISFVIPLSLFLVLHKSSSPATSRAASEVQPDLVGRSDPARTKAVKPPPPPPKTPPKTPPNRWTPKRR